MRKIYPFALIFAILLSFSCSQQKKQPEQQNDPTNPNGLAGFSQPNYVGWTTGSYVDEFGDKTKNKYLVNHFNGEISTSNAGYVPLSVKCIIDSSKIDFSFYEYGKYSFDEMYGFELNIKDPKGNIHKFNQFYFHDEKRDSIIKLLSMDGVLKASVRFSEHSRGRLGRFTVEGTSHLPEILKELDK